MAIRRLNNNKYRITIEMGNDPFGTRKRKTMTFNGSKQEAIIQEAKLREQYYHIGKELDINNLSFKEFSNLYMKKYCISNLSLITISKYEKLLTNINSIIGHFKLNEINSLILDDMFSKLRYGQNGQELSYNYLYDFYKLIRAMFHKAIDWELISKNPTDKINRLKKEYKEKHFYDFNQVNELIEALETESIKNKALITLALDSGARRSEICALRWSDIDFENKTMNINKSLKVVNGVVDEKNTKTFSSKREIVIGDSTIEILKEYKKWQDEQIKTMGRLWIDENRVFTSKDGKNMNPNSFGQILRKIIKRHHLSPICFHELRHTNASVLINSGLDPRTVSKRLGHCNSSITMEIYTHSFESSKIECAKKIDEIYQNSRKMLEN